MSVTIRDVAKYTGLSTSTVSRAISNSSLISEVTRHKVNKAVAILNYKPNAVARSMITKKTGNIGFIIYRKHNPVLSNPFYGPILESIVDTTNELGYNLFLSTDRDINLSGEIMIQKKVDGIILANRVEQEVIMNFKRYNIPVVLVNNVVEIDDLVCISDDNFTGAYEAIEYLINKEYHPIALLYGPLEYISHIQRFNGYVHALKKNNIKVDYNYIHSIDSTFEASFEAMQNILLTKYIPRAVFCTNDIMAVGAIKAIQKAGLSVPGNIAVLGFDGIVYGTWVEPSLTTVWTDKVTMGRLAVENLIKVINNSPIEDRIIIQKTKLVIREST